MGISYVDIGTQSAGATNCTPPYPAGAAAGQLGVLQVVSGHPDDPIPSTPTGWTRVDSFSGGGGTFGSGTGPRRLTWFVRVLVGGDPTPTVTLPSGTGATIGGRIMLLSRSAGVGWLWASALGEDTTSGTSFSAACSAAVTFRPGDFVMLGYTLPSGTTDITAEGINAAGVTFGTVTERADGATSTGNNARNCQATASVTAGVASATPTVTGTLSTARTGVAGVLRLREDVPKGDITATPQSVFPPRNLVAVTEMLAGDVVVATLYREVDGNLTELRAASDVDVTGQDALVRVDGEQPFGVAVAYAARLVDSLGDESLVYSGPITSTVASDVISDAVRGVGAKVVIEAWPDKKRTRDATVFNVGGRLVTVGRPRSGAQATVTVSTDTDEDGDALQEVLDALTEGVLLIRKQVTASGVDGYLALLDDSERRNWQTPYREWDLETAESEAWADVLEAAGFTLQDIADNYATLQDLANDFTPGTLLDIALYDWGV